MYQHARKYDLSLNMRIELKSKEIERQIAAAAGVDSADNLHFVQKARRDLERQKKFTSGLSARVAAHAPSPRHSTNQNEASTTHSLTASSVVL